MTPRLLQVLCCVLFPAVLAPSTTQAQAMDWSGFRAGLVTTFAFGGHNDKHTGLPSGPQSLGDYTIEHGSNGWAGGLVGGYFWQQGPMVEGFESDLQFGNIGGNKTLTNVALRDGSDASAANFLTFHEHSDTLLDLRGTFGYAASRHFLPYFTAGYIYLHGKYGGLFHDAVTGTDYPTSDGTGRSGWTIGSGIACQFQPGWVLKAEYLYYDVGTHTSLGKPVGGLQSQFDFEGSGSLLRLALTLRVP